MLMQKNSQRFARVIAARCQTTQSIEPMSAAHIHTYCWKLFLLVPKWSLLSLYPLSIIHCTLPLLRCNSKCINFHHHHRHHRLSLFLVSHSQLTPKRSRMPINIFLLHPGLGIPRYCSVLIVCECV